jgi:hypothetical protein
MTPVPHSNPFPTEYIVKNILKNRLLDILKSGGKSKSIGVYHNNDTYALSALAQI